MKLGPVKRSFVQLIQVNGFIIYKEFTTKLSSKKYIERFTWLLDLYDGKIIYVT